MNLEDILSAAQVGIIYGNLTVKAPGTQQRRVKDVGAVGRRNDDNALICTEAVHFHKQLVERLLTLIVSAAHARAAVTADGVDLINKDDRGGILFRLVK